MISMRVGGLTGGGLGAVFPLTRLTVWEPSIPPIEGVPTLEQFDEGLGTVAVGLTPEEHKQLVNH